MLAINSQVKVLAPFNESFPETYTITEVITHTDGTGAYILGDNGAFDTIYLEEV